MHTPCTVLQTAVPPIREDGCIPVQVSIPGAKTQCKCPDPAQAKGCTGECTWAPCDHPVTRS